MNKKADFLDKQHQEQMKIVKLNGTRNKKVAIMALKKAKRLEKQRDQVEGTLTTLEAQREALENASTNTEVMKIMGLSAKALKQAHGNMDLNKVEDLMDEVKEQHEIAEEIATVIRETQGFGSQFDEDELLKVGLLYTVDFHSSFFSNFISRSSRISNKKNWIKL